MKLFGRDLNQEVAFVAEIGVNHEGSLDKALALLALAGDAGADAVKFQSYTPSRYAAADDPDRLARVTRFALTPEMHHRLADAARRRGLTVFSTALTEDYVPLLAELFPAIKIASGDLTFEPVVRAAARTGKPVILSTGASAIGEVDQAVTWVRDEIGEAVADRLVLLHCSSLYPAPADQADVAAVPVLAQRYQVVSGYSNHVLGPLACHAAIALGARVIEAHFTDRKAGRSFRDHALSFEPDEFAALVAQGRDIARLVGRPEKRVQPDEEPLRPQIRKGVVAARDLAAGTVLGEADLMFARPATHFPASRVGTLIGRRLIRHCRFGESLTEAHFA